MSDAVELWLAAGAASVDPTAGPPWLTPLVRYAASVDPGILSEHNPPAAAVAERQAAVLLLIGSDVDGAPEIVLQQRSSRLRRHPGEISFPGERRESSDASTVDTALREAAEEIGLDRADVDPVAVFPRLHIVATHFDVTTVVAHHRQDGPLRADGGETLAVHRVAISSLIPLSAWRELHHPGGWHGPAIDLPFGTLWGYTADMVRATLTVLGARP